jgi:glycosyl hydrolase family 26
VVGRDDRARLVLVALATRLSRIGLFAAVVCAGAVSVSDVDAQRVVPASCGKLLPPASGAYFGAFPDFNPPEATTEDDVQASKVNDFQALAGRKIVWAYFSHYWFKGFDFPREKVLTLWRNGQIAYIPLLASSGVFYGSGPPQQYPELRFSLQNILAGEFDAELQSWADAARETNIPILVEFGTEVNDDWGPWNAAWNGAGETAGHGDPHYPDGAERFRDAYRHLVSLFREEGATNVTWFFHADSYPQYSWWNQLKWYFPGDEYVDWLGISDYGSLIPGGPVVGFAHKLDSSGVYRDLTSLSERPAAVVEMGVVDGKGRQKPNWIRDAFGALRSGRYPRIAAAVWWHMVSGEVDTRIDSSPESLAAFREALADPFFGAQPQFSGRCTPAAPRDVAATKGASARAVRVTWRAVPNAVSYEVWRSGRLLATTESTRYDDTSAIARRRYSYSVVAINPLGKSSLSTRAVGFRR